MITNWLPHFIVAHLIGDFLLQNADMAENKAKDTLTCLVHILYYIFPFLALGLFCGAPVGLIALIVVQHFLQDRFQLHLKWMKWFGQTTPEKWPMGPLLVDQSAHIAFIGLITLF